MCISGTFIKILIILSPFSILHNYTIAYHSMNEYYNIIIYTIYSVT